MEYLESSEVFEFGEMAVAVIRLRERMEVLGSTFLNGGHNVTDSAFIMQVPHSWDSKDPMSEILEMRERLGLPKDAVGFMTAAEVKYVFSEAEHTHDGVNAYVASTAGLSNHVIAGEVIENWEERFRISQERYRALIGGTINIIGVSPFALSDVGKINVMMPMIEGKSAAMADMGYRETGTTSDSLCIFSPMDGERHDFAGTGTALGIAMGHCAREAVRTALTKRGDFAEGLSGSYR